MNAVSDTGRAAAWADGGEASTPGAIEDRYRSNADWEIDRTLMLARSERRAWWVASTSVAIACIAVGAVFVQGPLRQVVEVPIVVDRVTGETTIQQRLSVETVPPVEALDKHNLAAFVRAREGYAWMFLQRDYDQVARMAVPVVFADYSRLFDGEAPLHKRLAASESWRIEIVNVRLSAAGRHDGRGDATVTYDKVVRMADRQRPDTSTRHVATIAYRYQPTVLSNEKDRLENPFGFVVTAYRSDPDIGAMPAGMRP